MYVEGEHITFGALDELANNRLSDHPARVDDDYRAPVS